MGGVKEWMINGRVATASQVRDGEKKLKQKLLHIESALQNILSQNLSYKHSVSYSHFLEIK